jgi:hypothetical protein
MERRQNRDKKTPRDTSVVRIMMPAGFCYANATPLAVAMQKNAPMDDCSSNPAAACSDMRTMDRRKIRAWIDICGHASAGLYYRRADA